LLARDADVGVVIRRGPSKCVATLLWDRRRDTFKLGQWLKGRIYERRCDLSPDGKHLIYFAMNGRWQSESRGSWTAISRAPYLKAVAMFPKGDCWYGGGLWTGDNTYWLNGGSGHSVLRDTKVVRREADYQPAGQFGGACPSVYYPRLLRDGWAHVEHVHVRQWVDKNIFEKPLGLGWTLRKIAHAEIGPPQGKGNYWDEHELVHAKTGTVIACPTWEWADRDGHRVVWADRGKLHAARVRKGGLSDPVELYDFNDMKFAPITAPY
jgi:hypothetical protein